ncbi:hypothetical protein HOLleu_09627 [Holothuria leucospilota]|uniref:Uncharacterized protein n=1 Tax=Holothuria leucospilota TaxID=206669 RepID=A0A9Q1CD33_HOLLE|nr:hypothetical protein HOLleu_09627 [Holothuria leucospilota]
MAEAALTEGDLTEEVAVAGNQVEGESEAGTVAEEESASGEAEKRGGLVRGKGSEEVGEGSESSGRKEGETGWKEIDGEGEKGAQGGFAVVGEGTSGKGCSGEGEGSVEVLVVPETPMDWAKEVDDSRGRK